MPLTLFMPHCSETHIILCWDRSSRAHLFPDPRHRRGRAVHVVVFVLGLLPRKYSVFSDSRVFSGALMNLGRCPLAECSISSKRWCFVEIQLWSFVMKFRWRMWATVSWDTDLAADCSCINIDHALVKTETQCPECRPTALRISSKCCPTRTHANGRFNSAQRTQTIA